MKKLLVILSSILVLGAAANAQEKETFYPGWQYGVQVGASHTLGAISGKYLASYPTVAINAGYEFVPWFGLRGNLSGYNSKGGIQADNSVYKFYYVQLAADCMFDICDMFRFKSTRAVNPYIFVGPALNVRFNNNEAVALSSKLPEDNLLWTNSVLAFAFRGGVGMDIRCSDAVKISLEVVDNILPGSYNSQVDNPFQFGGKTVSLDHNFSALLGVKLTIGQAKKKAAAVAAAAAAAEAARLAAEKAEAERLARERAEAERLARERAEADRLAAERAAAEAAAAKAAAEKAAKDAINSALNNLDAYPRFVIGKSKITKEAKKKINAAAEILKVNNIVKVDVTGYADKETGSATRNWELSKERAENVVNALVEAGVDPSQLKTSWKGDTEKVSNVPAQNRTVTFQVK